MVSPQELKRSAFTKTIKGYACNEVDEYVLFLLTKYTELFNAYNELEAKFTDTTAELIEAKSEENAIGATIVNAQKMADVIVNDAKAKANEIKGSVSDSCDRILDVYMSKVTVERDKLAKCEQAVAEFKNALYDAYKKHIELIDKIMPDDEPTPYLSDEELEDKAVELAKEKISAEISTELSEGVQNASAKDNE